MIEAGKFGGKIRGNMTRVLQKSFWGFGYTEKFWEWVYLSDV